jgi:hypothetical protein
MEFERIERTVSLRDTDKYCEAICAFSNDMAGTGQPGRKVIEEPTDSPEQNTISAPKAHLSASSLRPGGFACGFLYARTYHSQATIRHLASKLRRA